MWIRSHEIIPPVNTPLTLWSKDRGVFKVDKIDTDILYDKDGIVHLDFPPYWSRHDECTVPEFKDSFPRQNPEWFAKVPVQDEKIDPHFEKKE